MTVIMTLCLRRVTTLNSHYDGDYYVNKYSTNRIGMQKIGLHNTRYISWLNSYA